MPQREGMVESERGPNRLLASHVLGSLIDGIGQSNRRDGAV